MKIAVAGIGYVGLSNAILLAQHNEVTAVDVFQEKADLINNKKSPIIDREIEEYLANKELNLTATTVKLHTKMRSTLLLRRPPTMTRSGIILTRVRLRR